MTNITYNVLDRTEQAFTLFFKNPLIYLLPLAGLNILALVIIPEVFMALFGDMILAQNRASTAIIIIIMIGGIYAISYVTLLIPTTILIIKNSADSFDGKIVNLRDNISYSFANIGKVFSVYWYVFQYVYLIPALIFIAGGFLMLFSMITNNDPVQNISFGIMGIAGVYALIQGIYRGVKTKFALYGAIYNNDFSKEQFIQNLRITEGKWWRIIGNFFVAGFIAGLVIGIVSGLINSIGFLGADYGSMLGSVNNDEITKQESLEAIMGAFTEFSILGFIKSILSVFTNSLLTVFIFIFTLVFYKHLLNESGQETILVENKARSSSIENTEL